MIDLATAAVDKGTYVVTATFTNEDNESGVPISMTWSLYNENGTVINSRSSVSITPAASVNIVLSGDDLKYSDGDQRVLEVYAVYTSTNGVNLPARAACRFAVVNLFSV